MFKRSFDEEFGVIRVHATGYWDVAEIEDHFRELRTMIEGLRQRRCPVRVLIDIREAPRQSPAVESVFGDEKHATYVPGDRVAILVANLEEKNHVRTLLSGAEIWAWSSELAAEQWLLLDGTNAQTG